MLFLNVVQNPEEIPLRLGITKVEWVGLRATISVGHPKDSTINNQAGQLSFG